MRWLVFFVASAGLVTGLIAAWFWLCASKVPVQPTWAKNGIRAEPFDPDQARMSEIGGLFEAGQESARLNAKAAIWTAISVILSGASAVVGAWPISN